MGRPQKNSSQKPAKEKLLEAAFSLFRSKGYADTTVDDLCKEAKVTKGTFFHYFENKEAFAVAAAQHWSRVTSKFFKEAPYHKISDPLARLIEYIKFRKDGLQGKTSEITCLVGTLVQETYSTSSEIREACRESIFTHAETLESDIREAKALYAPHAKWSVESLALHTQAVIQGAFILAKASEDSEVAADSMDHLLNYIQLLFNKNPK